MDKATEPLISQARVARLLGVTVQTLSVWRRKGFGPQWYRVGRAARYRLSQVEEWIQSYSSGHGMSAELDGSAKIGHARVRRA